MEGSLRQAGAAAARRGAAGRRDHRRSPLGGDLQPPVPTRTRSSSCRTTSYPASSPPAPTTSASWRGRSARPSGASRSPSSRPYEALMRGFGYHFRLSPEEHAEAREVLERAVREAPANARLLGHAVVGLLARARPRVQPPARLPRPRARRRPARRGPRAGQPRRAAGPGRRALLPEGPGGLPRRRRARDRPQPARRQQRGVLPDRLHGGLGARHARSSAARWSSTPTTPGGTSSSWASTSTGTAATARPWTRSRAPTCPRAPGRAALLAAAHAQLGDRAAAGDALRGLLAQGDDVARSAHELFEKWFEPPLVEHLMDGLRKAGVTDAGGAPSGEAPAAATAGEASTGASPSIAVLPFANMSHNADKEQEYFSDGLAEEIINALVQVRRLEGDRAHIGVRLQGQGRGHPQDCRDARRDECARGQCAPRRNTDSCHRAVDSGRRRHASLVASATTGSSADIFAVQDEIAAAIAGALRLTFSTHGAPQRYTPALPAYEAYLKGRHHQARVTPDALEEARRSFESSIALDPRFGLAHVGIAAYWVVQMFFGSCRAHDAVPAATGRRGARARARPLAARGARAAGIPGGALRPGLDGRRASLRDAWRHDRWVARNRPAHAGPSCSCCRNGQTRRSASPSGPSRRTRSRCGPG